MVTSWRAALDRSPRAVRALVVDDSGPVRRLITSVLNEPADIDVVASATDGHAALQRIERLQPDVVTLDIEMPGLDGLQTLRQLRARWPRLPVIMYSALTERGARATLDALALGANDYVTKPSGTTSAAEARQSIQDRLLPLVRQWGRSAAGPPARVGAADPATRVTEPPQVLRRATPPSTGRLLRAVVIGVSTGGPNALTEILPQLPANLPVPVLIVQHMPATFTRILAERLDTLCALRVVEAAAGDVLQPGTVYLAPGGLHMLPVQRDHRVVVELNEDPPENFCRPAVDPLFRAAARIWGDAALGVVLTGMGHDGLDGSKALVDAGASVLAQDQASSVVWGMPGFVVRAGFAAEVLPLDRVAAAITQRTSPHRDATTVPAPPLQRTFPPTSLEFRQ